ncbi:MAG: hypothetical protein WBC44_14985 [Planctomycetaceae bacterium]
MLTARRQLAFVAMLFGGGLASAVAQSPADLGPPSLSPSNRPVTSPYLNLAIDDGSFSGPAYQYFRRVRPEVEFRRANARLGNEINDVRRNVGALESMVQSPESALGTTGHSTTFQNYRSFFPGLKRR